MAALDTKRFDLHLPCAEADGLDQDEEWCEIERDGERRRIRLHDYAAIYDIAGLYEQLFAELLECSSPEVVCDLLGAELEAADADPGALALLDVGAGNGMVGERVAELGVDSIVGLDLLPEARDAAARDRPDLYADYLALDLSAMSAGERASLEGHDFDAMTCVAALGFGDMPPAAFATAFNLVSSPGWIAFNLRARFIDDDDPAGFGALIGRMFDEGVLEERARKSYTHRVSVAGEPLTYLAVVATKQRDVPQDWAL
jgi:2-polyprenyl-3-methyl-5-hydroxy-6-metoxy-1,4-benzoquinol methylase